MAPRVPEMVLSQGSRGLKVMLPSRRNAHFQKKWCSRRGETLVFVFWGALGFKDGAFVEAKRSFSHFGLFFSSFGAQDGPRWTQVGPRWFQAGPRSPQEGSKRVQEGSRMASRGSKMVP